MAIEAVLFDWGHTLMDWVPEPELLEDGHRAGLAAIECSSVERDALAARFRERYLPLIVARDVVDEVEYPELIRRVLAEFDVEVSDDELARFLAAEHAAWAPARRLAAHSHALLDTLRERGLRLALVSNAFDPPWLLHADLEQLGIAERLDVAVFSSEVGKRKPHPAIFERPLAALDVPPERAMFVGDSLYHDIGGASRLGMTTVQALWFRADDDPDGGEPDYQAFTQMDVLNIVDRLNGQR